MICYDNIFLDIFLGSQTTDDIIMSKVKQNVSRTPMKIKQEWKVGNFWKGICKKIWLTHSIYGWSIVNYEQSWNPKKDVFYTIVSVCIKYVKTNTYQLFLFTMDVFHSGMRTQWHLVYYVHT